MIFLWCSVGSQGKRISVIQVFPTLLALEETPAPHAVISYRKAEIKEAAYFPALKGNSALNCTHFQGVYL